MLPDRQEDLLVAVALTEFSVHYEAADPELSRHAWQLAADRLVDHDVEPAEAVAELEPGAILLEADRLLFIDGRREHGDT